MKIWNKPQVSEQSVGLEVTSYMPAEINDRTPAAADPLGIAVSVCLTR